MCVSASVGAREREQGIAAPKDPFRANIVYHRRGGEGGEQGEVRGGVDLKASGPLRDYCLIALRLSNLTSGVQHREQLTTHTLQ